jgi:hypothetical protein
MLYNKGPKTDFSRTHCSEPPSIKYVSPTSIALAVSSGVPHSTHGVITTKC